jgi:hypothetical protein
MANPNAPKGFVPVRHRNGSPWNQQANLYCILKADTAAYYIGDAVKSDSGGGDVNGVPAVTKAAAGDTLRGVIVGFVPDPTNLAAVAVTTTTGKANNYYCYVVDDPSVEFDIQDDGSGTLTTSNINNNADFVVAAPTAPANQSATTMDAGGTTPPATTQALPLKIVGVSTKPQNNLFGHYTVWRVVINQHELMGNTAGV